MGRVRTENKKISKHMKVWQLYAMVAVPVSLLIIFMYIPMIGNIIAFQDFSFRKGFLGSPFVGLKYFNQFFNLPIFWDLLKNTIVLSTYSLVAGFPFPIILALALNELKNQKLKKTLQTITYAPFFISTVVMVGIIMQALSYRYGVVNEMIKIMGGMPKDFMGNSSMFRSIYVWSGVWQTAGYSSVLYIAALSSIDPTLTEAAIIDGANKFQRMINIYIPGIMPIIVITFILNAGRMFSIGFEKVYLLQNPSNYSVSEIISTYVYKIGIKQAMFSLSTAIGLFNAVINFIILFSVNSVAKRFNETSLF